MHEGKSSDQLPPNESYTTEKKFTIEVDNHTRIGRDLPAPLQLSLHTTQFPTYARRVTQRVARTADQRSTIPKTTGSNGGGRGREPEART